MDGKIEQIHSFQQVQDRYLEDGNDKLKLLILLCGEDDEQLQRAAAGALAMLTAAQKKLAVKMTKVVCLINKLQQLSDPCDSFFTQSSTAFLSIVAVPWYNVVIRYQI